MILGDLNVKCDKCGQTVPAKVYGTHLHNGCEKTTQTGTICIQDILEKPTNTPLTPLEQKLQSTLVKRSLTMTTDESVIRVKTRGQPITLVQVSSPRVSSGNASQKTVRRRSGELGSIRKRVSAGYMTHQLSHEILAGGKKERESLLAELSGGSRTVSPSVTLALKADLQIPWSKLRVMRRWLKSWGVQIASEKTMREEARELVGENLSTELAPFSFALKDGHRGTEIRNVPISFVPHLWDKVVDMLDHNDDKVRSIHRLTWHSGSIPEDEIWLKIGGDKGGGSFKLAFQICNVPKPNAPDNTCVFCAFEATDNVTNLHIAMDRYKEQIEALESRTWRGKRIKVFVCGDYEFLTRLFGLSGASGRHCCLWCLVTYNELQKSPEDQDTVEERSTDSICSDHKRFVQAGSRHKNAKMFNNVIQEPFFPNISLSQVCPPGLHITLGVFFRLFTLLEDKCHQLDLAVAVEDSVDDGGASYKHYIEALQRQTIVKEEAHRLNSEFSSQEQLVTLMSVMTDDPSTDTGFQQLCKELSCIKARLTTVESEVDALEQVLQKEFKKEDGPFVRGLDTALASFNVQRQAYYSGTFVGNHVHRTLKQGNLEALCKSLLIVSGRFSVSIQQQAETISRQFRVALELFGSCHQIYDKSFMSSSEITTLSQNIKAFMRYYRDTFPEASVIPKLHMLESHIVPWLKKWKVGLGMMGEQGAESIHSFFNSLGRTYQAIPDRVDRLHHMMREHHLHIAPVNVATCPPIKKRKKKD